MLTKWFQFQVVFAGTVAVAGSAIAGTATPLPSTLEFSNPTVLQLPTMELREQPWFSLPEWALTPSPCEIQDFSPPPPLPRAEENEAKPTLEGEIHFIAEGIQFVARPSARPI